MDEPEHLILPKAHEYEIIGLRLERSPEDGSESFLDLTLGRGAERHVLRFWSPQDLQIERGGPTMTSGLVIRDIRARGLEGIGVSVDDFGASRGSVRFLARSVEELLKVAG
jgi:hypothetical protein